MTPSPYIPITPATRIPFPCWLYGHFRKFVGQSVKWDYFVNKPCGAGHFTHYCTSATEPTGRPGEEVKEANSYFPPSTLDKWTHTSNEDLNRYFAREFWNRPIDERNNTYWHDDDKTSEDDNHEWKPLPDFCNDWPAVRKILRDSKVVVPPDFHGRDPSEICRRTMIYMLMSKNPTSEQPQSAVPTASGATGEALRAQSYIEPLSNLIASLKRGLSAHEYDLLKGVQYLLQDIRDNPDSRPAVAQEGVRDTERLDWLDAPPDVDGVCGRLAAIQLRLHRNPQNIRSAIDAAMSSQPEGRG